MFFRALLRQQEQNPVYYIRGKSSILNGTESFVIIYRDDTTGNTQQVTENVTTDAAGNWQFEYTGKHLYSLVNFANSNTTLLECDFSAADDFSRLTAIGAGSSTAIFSSCTNLTKVVFGPKNDIRLTDLRNTFYHCTSLVSVDLNNLTLSAAQNLNQLFDTCSALTSVDLHDKTFDNVTSSQNLFLNCSSLVSVDLHSATFENTSRFNDSFNGCSSLTTLDLSSLTLTHSTDCNRIFNGCTSIERISLPSATFASAGNINRLFYRCTSLKELNLPLANFSTVGGSAATEVFRQCLNLTDVTNSQPGTYTAASATSGCNMTESPLNYSAIETMANWLCQTTRARNFTVKATAWNAITAAEQATIQGILSGKNWTLATA